jgi:hypothetical protein
MLTICQDSYRVVLLPGLVRKERLELSRVTPLAPKTSASTNSATFAACIFSPARIRQARILLKIITACRYRAHLMFSPPHPQKQSPEQAHRSLSPRSPSFLRFAMHLHPLWRIAPVLTALRGLHGPVQPLEQFPVSPSSMQAKKCLRIAQAC